MENNSLDIVHSINNLSKEYAPYERIQLLSHKKDTVPPVTYQYYPGLPKGCDIAAELNLSRISEKLTIHKLRVYNTVHRCFLLSYLLSQIDAYASSSGYKKIYTTPTYNNTINEM